MWVSIKLQYNKETDADNRWGAVNKNTNWDWWKKHITNELYTTILWKEKKDVLDIILKHIDQNFWTVDMKKYEQHIIEALEKDKKQYIKKMEELTKHPIPYTQITCFFTTLPRCPYKWEKWFIWMYYKAKDPVRIFLHETLHFQFHWRYRNNSKVKALSTKQFEYLKESLTFLLNHEFEDFIEVPDEGYDEHQELIKQLEDYRIKQEDERDFEKLIEYWCDILLKK